MFTTIFYLSLQILFINTMNWSLSDFLQRYLKFFIIIIIIMYFNINEMYLHEFIQNKIRIEKQWTTELRWVEVY